MARYYSVPLFILGGGANLLISDAGIPGLVLVNRAGRVEFPTTAKILADSGAVLPSLARRCAKRGLSGLEWAVGVPGTIGGAVVNNAGAYGSDMAHNLVRAELLSPAGERIWQPLAWFEYGYRTSRLKSAPSDKASLGWIVLRAELHLTPAAAADVEARMTAFNQRRKAAQPPGATIGSMFKNPPGDYAGRLIEAAGLKGYRRGQAQISPLHANFFQNLGGARAADVLGLIKMAQETVQAKFGIRLELEIEVVGDFPT
jgi:UDP-N-acetylmuramate dehydrogenase